MEMQIGKHLYNSKGYLKQPRVPAGSSKGGEWTDGKSGFSGSGSSKGGGGTFAPGMTVSIEDALELGIISKATADGLLAEASRSTIPTKPTPAKEGKKPNSPTEVLQHLSDAYPAFSSFIKKKPVEIEEYKKGYIPHSTHQAAMGTYDIRNKKVLISTDSSLYKGISDKFELGGNVVDISPRGVMRHELGHHFYMHGVNAKSFKQLAVIRKKNPELAAKVSKYGATDSHELFAEMFTAYTHPDYAKSKNKLPEVLDTFMKGVLG